MWEVIFPFLCFIYAINKLLKPSVHFSLMFLTVFHGLIKLWANSIFLCDPSNADMFCRSCFPFPFSLISQFCQLMLHLFWLTWCILLVYFFKGIFKILFMTVCLLIYYVCSMAIFFLMRLSHLSHFAVPFILTSYSIFVQILCCFLLSGFSSLSWVGSHRTAIFRRICVALETGWV